MQLPKKLPLNLMQDKWSSILNPLLGNPLNDISVIKNVSLRTGVNVVNHLLQQMPQGWFLVDIQGPATIYRSAPYTDLTLTLTSSAPVTVNIGVY